MAGNIYSAHFQATLGAAGAERYCAYFAAPSNKAISLLLIKVECDYDATAGDDPVAARFERVTGTVGGGSAATPTSHDSYVTDAATATVEFADTLTGLSQTANSTVWDAYINPANSFRPGVKVKPSERWALALDPGAQAREAKISIYWEE